MDELLPLVYEELRRIAARELRGERPGHTLCTTALVHEAWMELERLHRIQWQNRSHYLALAAQAMRRVLIDHAVARRALKRGGGRHAETLNEDAVVMVQGRAEELLDLDAALDRLRAFDERQARIVECRFYGGMTIEETAEALDVSPATIKREWSAARAWLNREVAS
ncbi:MAG TPA: sigma-70 family RNA polymerase sigma factor [Vicinamibacterales bacterium]|nr:sigma-70 family RNA polymerase sigma factor [Vicinamibacterales bacterium]